MSDFFQHKTWNQSYKRNLVYIDVFIAKFLDNRISIETILFLQYKLR